MQYVNLILAHLTSDREKKKQLEEKIKSIQPVDNENDKQTNKTKWIFDWWELFCA